MKIRTRRWTVLAGVAAASLVLAACGSEVPPKEFVNAQDVNGSGSGNGNGAVSGDGSGTGGSAAGDGTGGGSLGGSGTGSGGSGSGGGSTGGGSGSGGGTTGGGSGSGGGSTSGGSGSGGKTGGGSTSGGSSSGGNASAGIKAGSCAGFKNSTGISKDTITIANSSDLSGPVPGLFKSAQAAVTAFVAYFNSTSSICGRKLKLTGLDSATSESGDQQAATTACSSAFALVGSMSAFDAGGANTVAGCGLPDLRAATTETARSKSPVSFGAYSLAVNEVPTYPFNYFKQLAKGGEKNAAFVYLNAGAASLNAKSFIAAETKLGYNFKDQIAIDVTSVPNYNGYATQLKGDGIKYVQYIGAYQYAQKLKSAFEANGYHPIFAMDPTAYDANFVAGGSQMNGTYVFIAGPLFDEAAKNKPLAAYLQWLQRTSGGAPSFFGTYAWAAASLFAQKAIELGGKLTRASLISALRGVHNFTNNGMVPPQDVGAKHTTRCASIIQLQGGKWVRKSPAPYSCANTINSGVGG